MKTKSLETARQPILNIDLRLFILPALYFMIFYLPLGRGLYFEPELLPFQMAVAILFTALWLDKVVRREVDLLPGKVQWLDVFALLFVIAYFQSIFVAFDERAAVGGALKVLMFVLFYRVVSEVSMDKRVRDWILVALFSSGVMVALIGLASAMGVFNYPGAFDGGQILSTLQYPNALAAYLLVIHIIGLSQWVRKVDRWSALFYGFGSFTFVLVILSSMSRATWIIFPFAVGLFILLAPKEKRWTIIYLEVVALTAGFVAASGFFKAIQSPEVVGLQWMLLGIALVFIGQIGYWVVQKSLNRFNVSDVHRQGLKVGAIVYAIVVILIYVNYVGQVLPHSLYQVVPEPVFGRASTISTADNSFLARVYSSSDGLKIIQDYPLRGTGAGGWNALYHQYQSYMYWTTEVHNHYVQVWIEAGLLGILSYVFIWLSILFLLYKLYRAELDEDQWLISAGVGVGAIAMGVHSGVDFDLSLPGLMLVVWTAFGLLRGQVAEREPKDDNPSGNKVLLGLVKFGMVILVALLLYYPSSRMYAAGKLGAEAGQALLREEYGVAESKYLESHNLDPWKGSYAIDLAQIYTFYGLITEDSEWFDESLIYLAYALEKQPYDITLRSKAIEILVVQGRWDLAIGQAEWMTVNLPLDVRSYEGLAQVSLLAAEDALAKGNKTASRTYLDKAILIPARVEQHSQASSGVKISRRPLKTTPTLDLYSGQAWLLKGDIDAARGFLEPLIKNKDVGREATIWLAAIEYLEGNLEESAVLLLSLAEDEQALVRFERVIWSYRELQEY